MLTSLILSFVSVMEFDFPSTLILVVTFMFTIFKLVKITRSESDLDRIPGPKKLPLIGNLHHLLSKSMPHKIFRDLAVKYGPLMRLQMGGLPYLIVSSVEVAEQVLKTQDIAFANRPHMYAARALSYNYSNIAFSPYGEYWRHLRKICTLELLSARRVKYFRPIREEENGIVAGWIASNEGSQVNLSEKISLCAFDITSRASVGNESEEKRGITVAIKELMKFSSGLSIVDLYPSNKLLPFITGINFKIRRIFQPTDRIFESIINQHRVAKAARNTDDDVDRCKDLTDILLKCQEDEEGVPLSTDNIKAVLLDMFLAGTDTSSIVVVWAMSEMLRNPTTLKRAQEEARRVFDDKGYVDEEKFDELKYLKLVIKETLRLHPPVPILIRCINNESCEINGYKIPAQTRVIVNVWALGRDPKYWKDAEKFMPERFEDSSIDFKGNNLEYIPFGAGRRMCPGITFGLANVEITLATLLYHFNWKIPFGIKNEELDMTETLGSTSKRKHDLVLIPTLKRPFHTG